LSRKQDFTCDLAEVGRYYWGLYQGLMERWHRVLPPVRILNVCYEGVVADLEGQARRIFAHCGFDWVASGLEFHKTERPVWTARIMQVRQPLYNHAVGRSRYGIIMPNFWRR
jgi:Sulfotransferase family